MDNTVTTKKKVGFLGNWKYWVFLLIAVLVGGFMDIVIMVALGGMASGKPTVLFLILMTVLFEYVTNTYTDDGKKVGGLVLGFLGIKVVLYALSVIIAYVTVYYI